MTDESQQDGQRLQCCSNPHAPNMSFTAWTLDTFISYDNGLGSAVWGHEHCSPACTCYRQKFAECRTPRLEYAFCNMNLSASLQLPASLCGEPSLGYGIGSTDCRVLNSPPLVLIQSTSHHIPSNIPLTSPPHALHGGTGSIAAERSRVRTSAHRPTILSIL
jgi:hypothetical protein